MPRRGELRIVGSGRDIRAVMPCGPPVIGLYPVTHAAMAGSLWFPLRPGCRRGDATDGQAFVRALKVASDPGRWNPARLVVEVVAGADANIAEVARAHVWDRGRADTAQAFAFASIRAGGVPGQVQSADADEGSLAFADAVRIVLERLPKFAG
jgi:hypothetical protein